MAIQNNYYVSSHKTFGFYIVLILAILSIVGGFAYLYFFSDVIIDANNATLVASFNWAIPILMIGGSLVYLISAIVKKDNIGAGVLAICNFIAFIIFVLGVYSYFVDMAMSYGSEDFNLFAQEGVISGVFVLAIQLLTMILGNLFAWTHLNSNPKIRFKDGHKTTY